MKTVSRAYDSYAQARAAVDAVEKAGIIGDDKQIALLTVGKHWAMIHEEPRVEVRIWSLT